MADRTANQFFSKKHSRLLNIAFFANIFAWIALIVQIVAVAARYVSLQNAYIMEAITQNFGQSPNFAVMLSQNPLYLINLVVNLSSMFIQGLVYWLVLKGISLGLNMIVETDLNYREKSQGGASEQ